MLNGEDEVLVIGRMEDPVRQSDSVEGVTDMCRVDLAVCKSRKDVIKVWYVKEKTLGLPRISAKMLKGIYADAEGA